MNPIKDMIFIYKMYASEKYLKTILKSLKDSIKIN